MPKLLDAPYDKKKKKLMPKGDLSERSIEVLGDHGYRRFKEFRDLYKAGWDFGRGKPLSKSSIALFDFFLRNFCKFHTEPSVFLTTAGNLQLIWEDRDEHQIIVEFGPDDDFMYYIEKTGEEGVLDVHSIDLLIEKILI